MTSVQLFSRRETRDVIRGRQNPNASWTAAGQTSVAWWHEGLLHRCSEDGRKEGRHDTHTANGHGGTGYGYRLCKYNNSVPPPPSLFPCQSMSHYLGETVIKAVDMGLKSYITGDGTNIYHMGVFPSAFSPCTPPS